MWKKQLTHYLAAKARYDEAKKLMHRAEQLSFKIAKRIGDDERAYDVAGVGLADRRSVRAARDMRSALHALQESLRGAPLLIRLKVSGAVMCANLPRDPV